MAIATHHKGGTVWIKRVIRSVASALGVPWIGIWNARHLHKVPETGGAFLVNWAGHFPPEIWARDDVAFAHVIRDPRDILLSGVAYHRVAGVKGEQFLHEPRADLNGATYQQHLNSLGDSEAALRFEMDNKHAETLAEMRAWPYGDPRCFEMRYEDLMQDRDCSLFGRALAHLGLRGAALEAGKSAFWANSLFGGLARKDDRTGRLGTHIRSDGTLRRWERELPRAVGRDYAARFGGDLIALGYERDVAWVDRLPERSLA